ncbi:HNH endonuclease [Vibrio sinensis]|uniref:HNH endonuclease n=1 Tax=Vibrio sinensis TaxID=2302434 RepID=UPI002436EF08|nr:HNH endonuclease signature motif containing protein [Vibrio sinensis]
MSYQKKNRSLKPTGTSEPKASYRSTIIYERSPQVKAWVLNRAGGICEFCQQQAPFMTLSGSPYLEVHHVRRLSLGGSDTASNCVALCPNCHRSFHYSIEHELLVDKLYQLNTELIRE